MTQATTISWVNTITSVFFGHGAGAGGGIPFSRSWITHTEGNVDGKIKVFDVPHCAVKLQAGNILSNFKKKLSTQSLPYEHIKNYHQDGDHPHFLCSEEIQIAWRCPVIRHLV